MTEAETRRVVSEAVAETLLKLGIDTSDPVELQKDMAYLRSWRESIAQAKRHSIFTVVGVITLGVMGLIWMAVTKGG